MIWQGLIKLQTIYFICQSKCCACSPVVDHRRGVSLSSQFHNQFQWCQIVFHLKNDVIDNKRLLHLKVCSINTRLELLEDKNSKRVSNERATVRS